MLHGNMTKHPGPGPGPGHWATGIGRDRDRDRDWDRATGPPGLGWPSNREPGPGLGPGPGHRVTRRTAETATGSGTGTETGPPGNRADRATGPLGLGCPSNREPGPGPGHRATPDRATKQTCTPPPPPLLGGALVQPDHPAGTRRANRFFGAWRPQSPEAPEPRRPLEAPGHPLRPPRTAWKRVTDPIIYYGLQKKQ